MSKTGVYVKLMNDFPIGSRNPNSDYRNRQLALLAQIRKEKAQKNNKFKTYD